MPDQWSLKLSEYLDGNLDPAGRSALEDHLEACDDCRDALSELRRVVGRAQALDDRPPAGDIWPGIAARIGITTERSPDTTSRRFWSRSVSIPVPQLLAAGIALVLISGGTAWMLGDGDRAPAGAVVEDVSVVRAVATAELTATRYDRAIGELLTIVDQQRDVLGAETVQVLQENLAVIDRAIQRSREALLADPESEYLRSHFQDTVRKKMTLLQRVTTVTASS